MGICCAALRSRTVCLDLGFTEPASEGRIRSSVLLYRMRGVDVASDRFTTYEGKVGRPAEDCVYGATDCSLRLTLCLLLRPGVDLGLRIGNATHPLRRRMRSRSMTDIAPRSYPVHRIQPMLSNT